MTGKRLIDRLDDAANVTGIPQLNDALQNGTQRRRPMRWPPIAALVSATIGLGLLLSGIGWGQPLMMIGIIVSSWMPIFGPIKPWAATSGVDERDEQVRAAGYLAALPAILIAAVLMLLYVAWRVADERSDRAGLMMICTNGALYLVILWNVIPTLHASWRTRPDWEDGDV